MSLKVLLEDGRGGGNLANFDELGAMLVSDRPEPGTINNDPKRTFRQFFTLTGEPGASNDMRVNGSVTPVDFMIRSQSEFDRYIMSISFEIADANAVLDQFGTIGVLINGCQLFYESTEGIIFIHDAMRTNWDFVRLAHGNPPFGSDATSFRAANVIAGSEGYIPVLNFQQVFGYRWGIALKGGTNQRMVIRIRDDVTTIDSFNAIAFGFDRRRQ